MGEGLKHLGAIKKVWKWTGWNGVAWKSGANGECGTDTLAMRKGEYVTSEQDGPTEAWRSEAQSWWDNRSDRADGEVLTLFGKVQWITSSRGWRLQGYRQVLYNVKRIGTLVTSLKKSKLYIQTNFSHDNNYLITLLNIDYWPQLEDNNGQ